MRIIKDESVPNPSFVRDVYDMGPESRGYVYRDRISGRVVHELWDGKRSYNVPDEVFTLWLKAYETGKVDGKNDAIVMNERESSKSTL